MSIGAISSNPLLFLNSLLKGGDLGAASFDIDNGAAQANSAAPLSILPSSVVTPLSFASILALQSLDDPPPATLTEMSATEKFLAEAQKSPMQRMREQVLGDLGLTEDALAQLPPEQRSATEDKIRDLIEEKLRQAMGGHQATPRSNAAMLQSLIGV